jgi:hypothetical protein
MPLITIIDSSHAPRRPADRRPKRQSKYPVICESALAAPSTVINTLINAQLKVDETRLKQQQRDDNVKEILRSEDR